MNTNKQSIQELQDFKITKNEYFTLYTNEQIKIFVSKKGFEIMCKKADYLSKINSEVLEHIYQEYQEKRKRKEK